MPMSRTGISTDNSGFTLIELILVVLLLGLLSGLSLPLLGSIDGGSLEATARRLSGTVKFLYNEAVMTGLEQRLVFDVTDGSYRTETANSAGEFEERGGLGRRHRLPGSVRFESIYQPRSGDHRAGEVTTAMLPEGWLDETIIYLRDGKNRSMTLRLVPLTGLTEFYQGYRDFR